MESIRDKLRAFLPIGCVDNSPYGSGSGDSFGSGSGEGSGSGSCNDSGSCYAKGYSSGYTNGDGCGDGNDDYHYNDIDRGNGSGFNDGNGSGSGRGGGESYGIKNINGIRLYDIDDIATGITAVYGNVAKGYILRKDLTMVGCYIAKNGNIYAHGDTLAKALSALNDKLFDNMSTDDRINAFISKFKHDIKYHVKDFYEWHHKLTKSCEQGRKEFAISNNIDLDNDMYTVDEFIELTENSYKGEIIKKLKEKWQANG